jgi:hypothetical protein
MINPKISIKTEPFFLDLLLAETSSLFDQSGDDKYAHSIIEFSNYTYSQYVITILNFRETQTSYYKNKKNQI